MINQYFILKFILSLRSMTKRIEGKNTHYLKLIRREFGKISDSIPLNLDACYAQVAMGFLSPTLYTFNYGE